MLETITAASLLTLVEIVAPVALGLALVYAVVRLRSRSRAERAYTDAATRRLYRQGDRRENEL